jgi:hypothetical protein
MMWTGFICLRKEREGSHQHYIEPPCSIKGGKFLRVWSPISFWRTLVHGYCYLVCELTEQLSCTGYGYMFERYPVRVPAEVLSILTDIFTLFSSISLGKFRNCFLKFAMILPSQILISSELIIGFLRDSALLQTPRWLDKFVIHIFTLFTSKMLLGSRLRYLHKYLIVSRGSSGQENK